MAIPGFHGDGNRKSRSTSLHHTNVNPFTASAKAVKAFNKEEPKRVAKSHAHVMAGGSKSGSAIRKIAKASAVGEAHSTSMRLTAARNAAVKHMKKGK